MEKEERKVRIPDYSGVYITALLSILFIIIGIMMLCMKQMLLDYFCYLSGGLFLIWGIWMIGRYFLHEKYLSLQNYDFAIGTMLVILGVCALIRAHEIAKSAHIFLGILILIEAVIMLQHAVMVKSLRGSLWVVHLILSAVGIVFSVLLLLDKFPWFTKKPIVFYAALLVIGGMGIVSLILVAIRTKKYPKEMEKGFTRNLEDADDLLNESQNEIEEALEESDIVDNNDSQNEIKEVLEESDLLDNTEV